ncbi:MAG: c-type cytochrome [Asticcacaulis sp.]
MTADTQVAPVTPEPFARQQVTADLLTHRTPAAHAAVAKVFAGVRSRGPFDPPSLGGTILFSGMDGGAEWGGAAYDPQTGLLYVNANEMAWILKLKPQPVKMAGASGEALYQNTCASCHGEDRKGSPPEFPSLAGVASRMTREQIAAQIRNGGGRMPAFGGQFSASDIQAIAGYLAGDVQAAKTASAYSRYVGRRLCFRRLQPLPRSRRLSGRRPAVGHPAGDQCQ